MWETLPNQRKGKGFFGEFKWEWRNQGKIKIDRNRRPTDRVKKTEI